MIIAKNLSNLSRLNSCQQVHQNLKTVIMAKRGIHPEFYPEAKVFCNGEVVMTVGGSSEKYVVDLWSGNHPFFLAGAFNTIVVDEGQVNRFRRRFAGLEKLSTVQTVNSDKK